MVVFNVFRVSLCVLVLFYMSIGAQGQIDECRKDVDQMLSSNKSADDLKALDAFGKPGSGLLVADYIWIGTYEECQDLAQYHYCMVDINVNLSNILPPKAKNDTPSNGIPARWGTCFPKTCNETEVVLSINSQLFNKVGFPFPATPLRASCADKPDKWNDGVFVFTVVLSFTLGCLMLVGYALDVWLQHKDSHEPEVQTNGAVDSSRGNDLHVSTQSAEGTPLLKHKQGDSPQHGSSLPCRFLLCFAVNRNLKKLLDSNQNERSILCLNGVRFISMTWVILGHTCVLILSTQDVDNVIAFIPIVKSFGFQVVMNAPYAVDTFFLLSGMLVTLGCLNRLERNNGKLPWAWFYFHRFWRLTPALGYIILFTMIQQHIGEGPAWLPLFQRQADNCYKYWWSTLLYINNFYPTRFNYQCVGHTWYLANDMQFFVISPIFIILLHRVRKIGLLSLLVTCLVSFGITIGLIVKNDFDLANAQSDILPSPTGNAALGSNDYTTAVYQKPYCRIPVYLVGMAMGLLFQQRSQHKIRIPKVLVGSCWLLAIAFGMLPVYGLYPAVSTDSSLSPFANALYGALSRFTWGIAVSWVIFACYFGYAGPINSLLSWRGWVVPSRLTYTAYLIHQAVIYQYYQAQKIELHADKQDFGYSFVSFVGMSYAAAMVFSLAIEYPFANMEKLFMPSTMQSRDKPKTELNDSRRKTDYTHV